VQKAVEKISGTQAVAVNLLTNSLQLEYDEQQTSAAAIIAAVELNTRKNHKVLQTTENEQFTETAWLKNRRWS
jgi:cation transport ATPase